MGDILMKIYDGHVHTPFCPHGTKDDFKEYIERGIQLGYAGLSFTEHAPLPERFCDPTPEKDSAMSKDDLFTYIAQIKSLKDQYREIIEINIGLEVDFIEGYESETKHFLNEVGPYLDDSILSVHFLYINHHYYCLDYSLQGFQEILRQCDNNLQTLYEKYRQTVLMSIETNLGQYKPTRIGHITLPTKYQKVYPMPKSSIPLFIEVLDEVKENHLTLDYNGAGVAKPDCGEPYPPTWLVQEAVQRQIPLIYGSDAHKASDLRQGFDALDQITLSHPLHIRK